MRNRSQALMPRVLAVSDCGPSAIKQLADLRAAQGGLTRLAADHVRRAGIKLDPLLSRVGLTPQQIDDPDHRINVRSQIAFLEAAAKALHDDFLGFNLAEKFDCRGLGLLYYVMASSDTLGTALKRAARYSRFTNEAVVLQYREGREPTLRLTYSGIPRHVDQHQIEFFIVAMVRVSRLLCGRRFFPKHVSMIHVRSKGVSNVARCLGTNIEFGREANEIGFPAGSAGWSVVDADLRLNKILLQVWEEARAPPVRYASLSRYDLALASLRPRSGERRRQGARVLDHLSLSSSGQP
jgi:hypothetical protein